MADANKDQPQGIPFVSGLRSMETAHKPLLMLRCKVVVVGDSTVGKSALVQMFHSGGSTFPRQYVMTTWVDFCVKQVRVPNTNALVEMYIVDCAGQSVFNQVEQNNQHYENASYVAVVYDVSNKESFESAGKWLQAVRSSRPPNSRPVPGVLIANKTDLREQHRGEIPSKDGLAFAEHNQLEFFETSAASGTDIDEPFHFIAHQVYHKYEATLNSAEQLASTMMTD